jgi:endoglucanase
VNPNTSAAKQADAWKKSRPDDAQLMRYIAAQPTATWFGDWNADVRKDVSNVVGQAASQGALPVLVAYDIPNRDCGSYSAGGAGDAQKYGQWIKGFADGINGRKAVVILEPDAVAGSDCLSSPARDTRLSMIRDAVKTLKNAGAFVYIDAGNAHWIKADAMADRLRKAGIDLADGFSLNVSNFFSTNDNIAFGNSLSHLVGGKHYVIDTSRNGLASTNGQWCNPAGQSLGAPPTTQTGRELVDAFLWVKLPGESDGTCNGGPKSGQFWADYALGLAQRANIASN